MLPSLTQQYITKIYFLSNLIKMNFEIKKKNNKKNAKVDYKGMTENEIN